MLYNCDVIMLLARIVFLTTVAAVTHHPGNIACPGVCVALRIAQYCEAYMDARDLCVKGKVCCVSEQTSTILREINDTKFDIKRPTVSPPTMPATTRSPKRPCTGDCVDRVFSLFCDHVQHDMACYGNKICCVIKETPSNTKVITTTTPKPGPKCLGDCVSPVFAVSCDKLDEQAVCTGMNRCCLDRLQQTTAKPNTTTCRGFCYHKVMSDFCFKWDRNGSCDGEKLCCIDDVERNTSTSIASPTQRPENKCRGDCVDPIHDICGNVDFAGACPGMTRCCLDEIDDTYISTTVISNFASHMCRGECVDHFSAVFRCQNLADAAVCPGKQGCCLDKLLKPSTTTSTTTTTISTPSPPKPCSHFCVDPVNSHCYNPDEEGECPNSMVCCYDLDGITTTKQPSFSIIRRGPPCAGECKSGLFSLLCAKVDEDASCPGDMLCCLPPDEPTTTVKTTTTTVETWPRCPGQCIHRLLGVRCDPPAELVDGTECEPEGWQCCVNTRLNEVYPQ
ncbi:protein masquerade-like isoform X1 [Helicoverpa zea]|uniref:protein masquerade-like isoform X1 n=1 Tax=Helicoverpa zea TaxID=7113 RepID=UPI001F5A25EF|nr:protein masquerade-like isoform X1 [Helicoverpa zea]